MSADYIIHAVGPVWEGGDSGEAAAHIAVSTVAETLRECPGIEMVTFVTYDQDMEEFYLGELERL